MWDQLDHQRTLSMEFAARMAKAFGTKAHMMEHYLLMMGCGRVCLIQVIDESFKRRLGTETDPATILQMTALTRRNDQQCESAVVQLREIFDSPGSASLCPWSGLRVKVG